TLINDTATAFEKLEQRLTSATNAAQLAQLLLELQQEGGALLDTLAGKFQEVTGTLAGAKGNPWRGPGNSSADRAPSASSGGAGAMRTASASTGGGNGPSAASSAASLGGTASAGATDGTGSVPPDLAGEPTLQGLESSGLS